MQGGGGEGVGVIDNQQVTEMEKNGTTVVGTKAHAIMRASAQEIMKDNAQRS